VYSRDILCTTRGNERKGVGMSYHDLSECTLTNDERVEEKNRILSRLLDMDIEFTDSERKFIFGMEYQENVTVKQLFWLRDINNKY